MHIQSLMVTVTDHQNFKNKSTKQFILCLISPSHSADHNLFSKSPKGLKCVLLIRTRHAGRTTTCFIF